MSESINLRNTYLKKHYANNSEVYGNASYEFLYPVADKFITKGYRADQYGTECGDNHWKGLLYHQMIIMYTELFYNEYQRLIEAGIECPIEEVKESFKYDCVIANLDCLSKTYGGDLRQLLNISLSTIGIDINIDCDSCCEGISTMVVGGIDPCNTFEIDQCNN